MWEESTFKKLGALFGDFLDFDDATVERSIFDFARILVSTDRGTLINEYVNLKAVGSMFKLAVFEEGGFLPVDKADDVRLWETHASGESDAEEVVGMELRES